MTAVQDFLQQLGRHGQLVPQRKRTIFHFEFPNQALLCFKTIRSSEHIRFHSISVGTPKQGVGTELMLLVCNLADGCGLTIELTALPFGPAGKIGISKLVSWYRKFGFVMNEDYYEDKVIDISEGMEMIRDPR